MKIVFIVQLLELISSRYSFLLAHCYSIFCTFAVCTIKAISLLGKISPSFWAVSKFWIILVDLTTNGRMKTGATNLNWIWVSVAWKIFYHHAWLTANRSLTFSWWFYASALFFAFVFTQSLSRKHFSVSREWFFSSQSLTPYCSWIPQPCSVVKATKVNFWPNLVFFEKFLTVFQWV